VAEHGPWKPDVLQAVIERALNEKDRRFAYPLGFEGCPGAVIDLAEAAAAAVRERFDVTEKGSSPDREPSEPEGKA
jgi:hypothetical protein